MGFFKILFPLVFAIAGTLFLAIAYKEGSQKYKINTEGIETDGLVIDIYRKPRKANESWSTAQAPVIQFVTKDYKVIKYYSTTFLTPCPYQVGTYVKIKYLPENPQEAILDWKDAWILTIAFGAFGSVICLASYYYLLKNIFNQLFQKK